jgi:hypothetical protein
VFPHCAHTRGDHYTGLRLKEEQRYSFVRLRARTGWGGCPHAPAALRPRNTWYPLYRRLGGPQGQSGRVRKISPLPRFYPRSVQPVASRYTDYAIPVHALTLDGFNSIKLLHPLKIQKTQNTSNQHPGSVIPTKRPRILVHIQNETQDTVTTHTIQYIAPIDQMK